MHILDACAFLSKFQSCICVHMMHSVHTHLRHGGQLLVSYFITCLRDIGARSFVYELCHKKFDFDVV